MKQLIPKITFDYGYLKRLAIKEAKKLPAFEGCKLCASMEVDQNDIRTGSIIVSEIVEEKKK